MTKYISATFISLSLVIVLMGCSSLSAPGVSVTSHKPVDVFLVRHAEKESGGHDPALTDAGRERAITLSHLLGSAGIEFIHSSDYSRTKQTAAPTAMSLGLDVQLYNPSELSVFADELKAKGGRHLVVGHSNTTPVLVELLGGDPVSPIDEKSEYDRLYLISIAMDGSVTSVLLRFGEEYF